MKKIYNKYFLLFLYGISAISICNFFVSCTAKQSKKISVLNSLKNGFEIPQDSTRTKVWWFHGETETTKEGITADLEAFKKVGVGGVIYYDQNHGKAEKALEGFSKEWWEMLRFSAEEAKRLGLTFEIHISNGYVAGGPWIDNENSMKRLVATEMLLDGGKRFTGKLAEPKNKSNFYKDVAVLAFPAKRGTGKNSATEKVIITSDNKDIDLKKLFNPSTESLTKIERNESGIYINLQFEADFEARSITYKMQPRGKATTSATNVPGAPAKSFVGTGYRVLPDFGQLEVSADGIHFEKVCDLKPIYKAHESWRQKTLSFSAVKAKYYRLYLHDWWEETEKNQQMMINSIVLNSSAKIDLWEEKAGLFAEYTETSKSPNYSSDEVIASDSIIDITDKLDANGLLNWEVPSGKWNVIRFAYEPTGASIKHGRSNLLGKECDKLSVKAAKIHWDNYVGRIADSLNISGSGHLTGVAMDSHEAGAQNWTDDFIKEFETRQGYNAVKFLPAMVGYVVDGTDKTESFLFDVRRNIADMISDNYYGTFDKLSKERGLTFTAQAVGNALCIVADPIQAKSKVSKPQGEFWVIHPDGNYDIKESSSSAHLYGKTIASAEAYTDTKYSNSLSELKSLADYAYAFGINEFVICASAYQPWLDKIPGSTGGGRHYAINRSNTWWNYSKPFWDYQARSAYLMRIGKPHADICVYLGENAPVKILTYRLPNIPGGFDFDAFTTDALINRMQGDDGKIVLPDRVNYKMMVLPESGDLTLNALRKIASIVKMGGNVFGNRPVKSASAIDLGKDDEYQQLVAMLWGKEPTAKGKMKTGKGFIYWGMTLEDALKDAQIKPDVVLANSNTKDSKIYFCHRELPDSDIFFLDNHKDVEEKNTFTFNSVKKHAQLWNPVTGERFSIVSKNGLASYDLVLAPKESYFIILTDNYERLPVKQFDNEPDKVLMLNDSWNVFFDKKMGGPGNVKFDSLTDWTKSSIPGIKYYSGTAIYSKDISLKNKNKKVCIETGNPDFITEVKINGKSAGIIWCSPWQLDITNFLSNGKNTIEIHVANSLMNRMIYDSQLLEKDRITYSYPEIVQPNDKLEPSGLTEVKLLMYE
ncbi:glycosyl hydrolase family 2 [Flavobacterium sp. Sd200]|uniref:glycosyl hydrolase n=1 Tax=Flavobacterium sp. Sd200 TaxID=2692211 RepID=UPI00136BD9A9|nr:glycosyl hydrolase [Flavobacterium sp. Sd200]MXN90209.1 glycosyl hydrolase family 2 [Flavobacterium sp. Sd200]